MTESRSDLRVATTVSLLVFFVLDIFGDRTLAVIAFVVVLFLVLVVTGVLRWRDARADMVTVAPAGNWSDELIRKRWLLWGIAAAIVVCILSAVAVPLVHVILADSVPVERVDSVIAAVTPRGLVQYTVLLARGRHFDVDGLVGDGDAQAEAAAVGDGMSIDGVASRPQRAKAGRPSRADCTAALTDVGGDAVSRVVTPNVWVCLRTSERRLGVMRYRRTPDVSNGRSFVVEVTVFDDNDMVESTH